MAYSEKLKSGNYRLTASAGYDNQGKQIRKTIIWKPLPDMTDKQIAKELERQKVLFEESVKTGSAGSGSIKFQDFAEQWFTDYAETHLRASTLKRYRQLTKRTYEALGHKRIDRITPQDLIKFYNSLGTATNETECKYTVKADIKAMLKECGLTYAALSDKSGVSLRTVKSALNGENVANITATNISKALQTPKHNLFAPVSSNDKVLASKTIKHYHTFISSVLERAVKWGLIASNPCRRVDTPKAAQKELKYLNPDEAVCLLKALQNEHLEYQVIFNILLLTGMRRGEIMGLEWKDFDFENKTVFILRTSQYTPDKGIYTDTTKTEKSKRLLSLPEQLVQLLKKYKRYQMERQFALGDRWVATDRLFTKWNGEPMHPNTPYSYLQKLLIKCSLPKVSLHSLRHTNATIMINGGTDIKTVSSRLGHSQTSTTLNIYAHALQKANEAAAEVISSALRISS